mmetsp:Transcript_34010/g.56314  ORF Transcript_34010/g.56314 Transcript_34010/m.56314 type:complete len:215 (+) Transcript_34010:424-1068(+)
MMHDTLASSASVHTAIASCWGSVTGTATSGADPEAREGLTAAHSSTCRMMACCMATLTSGYLPLADSPDSMTASACSRTALVTSATSARVGRGLACMLSSIWVATTTGLPRATHKATISFCQVTTCSMGISTPRSPLATIIPSDSATISSRLSRASVDSILEMISGCGVISGCAAYCAWQAAMCLRISRTPSPLRTNDAATMSMSCSMPNRMSS